MPEPTRFGSAFTVLLSIIISAAVTTLAMIFIPPFITVYAIIAMFVFALLVLMSALSVITAAASNASHTLTRCVERHCTCLLVGLLGSIVTSVIAIPVLLFAFAFLFAPIAVIFSAVFFFSIAVISLIMLLSCILARLRYRNCDR